MLIDTPAWVRGAVFYQVFPDRLARSGLVDAPGELEPWDAPPTVRGFKGGDLYGVIDHLDRLRRLGITALYLNPVFASASNHRYHTDDYYNIDPLLGGNEALRELLEQAHARDMRVVLDGVFNHCGRGFWPFHHVLENGAQSPYRDWFYLSDDVRSGMHDIDAFPDAEKLARLRSLRKNGAALGSASTQVLGYEAWWDLPALPKLNLDEPHLRELMLDVTEFWIRFGIDGWRLDVAEDVGADFWREFRQRARSVEPDAYLVAEVWHPKPDWLAGDMFDAFMNYPLLEAVIGFAGSGHIDASVVLAEEFKDGLQSFDAASFWARVVELDEILDPAVTAVQLNLLGSHDMPRLRTICGGDLDSVRLATLLQMTLPGAPCIYYGDEIGMEGEMDPGSRGGFPWDSDDWEREPYPWMADAVALRHSSRALRDGELTLLRADGQALAYLRRFEGDAFVVVVNAAEAALAWSLSLPLAAVSADVQPLRGEHDGERRASLDDRDRRRLDVRVPARDGVVIRISSR